MAAGKKKEKDARNEKEKGNRKEKDKKARSRKKDQTPQSKLAYANSYIYYYIIII